MVCRRFGLNHQVSVCRWLISCDQLEYFFFFNNIQLKQHNNRRQLCPIVARRNIIIILLFFSDNYKNYFYCDNNPISRTKSFYKGISKTCIHTYSIVSCLRRTLYQSSKNSCSLNWLRVSNTQTRPIKLNEIVREIIIYTCEQPFKYILDNNNIAPLLFGH